MSAPSAASMASMASTVSVGSNSGASPSSSGASPSSSGASPSSSGASPDSAPRRRRPSVAATLALLATLAAGCAQLSAVPRPAPAPPAGPGPSAGAEAQRDGEEPRDGSAEVEPGARVPPGAPRSGIAASTTLLAQSRGERSAGDHAAAIATLERAMRIDPNNAALWIETGEIELERGNAAQAAAMARKALTLTAGDAALTRRAERLLDAAAR